MRIPNFLVSHILLLLKEVRSPKLHLPEIMFSRIFIIQKVFFRGSLYFQEYYKPNLTQIISTQ